MKRAIAATGVTIAGVVWVLTYRVTPPSAGIAAVPPAPGPGDAQPSPGASVTPTPAGVSGTFTGSDVSNRYGDVQVRVVVSNGHLTDVTALRLPSDRATSAYISQVAGPMLRSEALQAQSARIDIISGAAYTSVSYAQSLESALRQAHLG